MGVQEGSLVRGEEPHKLAAHDLSGGLKSTAGHQTAPTPSVTYTVDTHAAQGTLSHVFICTVLVQVAVYVGIYYGIHIVW